MGEIGHNGGPSLEAVRVRVKRAQALGLDDGTCAGGRAAKLAVAQCGRLAGYLPAERYFG